MKRSTSCFRLPASAESSSLAAALSWAVAELVWTTAEIWSTPSVDQKEEGKTMGKSINRSVWIRVACALLAVLLFSVMITISIIRMDRAQTANEKATTLLTRCHQAETAHYKWASNLRSAPPRP